MWPNLYTLLKVSLDPIVLLLVLIVVGFFTSLRIEKKRYIRIIFLAPFLILYIISISPVSNALCYLLEKEYLLLNKIKVDNLDIVVVLGGGVYDNKYLKTAMPSYQTTSRLLYAVQVFRESEAKYLVCTGKGGGRISEADVMAMAAKRAGVPASRIRVESASMNTWEHAQNLNNMFQDKDIKIGLVTSAFHMKRSEREFRKYFSNIIPLPSDYLYSSIKLSIFTFLPRSGNLYKFAIAFNEIIGIGWYRIKG